jgi:Flagellin and related hook-associated proteins
MGKAVADLKAVMQVVMTRAAEVGGRENRLEITYSALTIRTYSEEDNLSQMEDVDLTELMTRLSQQQVAYNSVLKSSSMIMQMSLVNFL